MKKFIMIFVSAVICCFLGTSTEIPTGNQPNDEGIHVFTWTKKNDEPKAKENEEKLDNNYIGHPKPVMVKRASSGREDPVYAEAVAESCFNETYTEENTSVQVNYSSTQEEYENTELYDNYNYSYNYDSYGSVADGSYYCTYVVQEGDTYYKLQCDYWVTKEQICAFNHIDPNQYLQAGWVIYIPLDTYIPPYTWSYDYGNSGYDNSNYYNGYEYDNSYSYDYSGTGQDYGSSYESSNNWWSWSQSDGMINSYAVTLWTTNSEWASWYNIKLAAGMLNGFSLGPGESFNWFWNMGACSYEQGFIDAGAYTDTGTAPGGGICFVSTALMQAARGSGCPITEKHDHRDPNGNPAPVSYATPGNEASVSYGSCNLRFYNPSSTDTLTFYICVDEWSHSITVSSVVS